MLPTIGMRTTRTTGRVLVQYGKRRYFTKPLIKLGVQVGRLNTLGKLSHRLLSPEDFIRDSFAHATLWDGHEDPFLALQAFMSNQERIHELAELVAASELPNNGHTDLLYGGTRHQYFFRSRPHPVPEWAVPYLDDPDNLLPFAEMLTMFPPYGLALSGPPTKRETGEYNPIVLRGLRSVEQVSVRALDLRKTGDINGLYALGDSSTISISGATVVADKRRIIRGGLALTTPDHVYDGGVGWLQHYDRLAQTVRFTGQGVGDHILPPMDGLNSLMGGFVFSTMIRGFVLALTVQAERAKAGQSALDLFDHAGWYSPSALAVREQLSRDPDLLNCWATAHVLDQLGRVASTARRITGGRVVGPPSAPPASSSGKGTSPVPSQASSAGKGNGEWSAAWPLLSVKLDMIDDEHEAAEEASADAPAVVEEIDEEPTGSNGSTKPTTPTGTTDPAGSTKKK
jgi:hypothetical protein